MILDSFRLDGRVALVTGGNRGIGQAYAIALAEAGADIALLDRSDPAETMAHVAKLGRRVTWVPCDLSVAGPAELAAAVDTVVARARAPRHPRQQRRHHPPRRRRRVHRRPTGTT